MEGLPPCISAVSMNNAYYVLRRADGPAAARRALILLRDVFRIVPLDAQTMQRAIDADFAAFEDALHFFSAHHAGAQFLLTRNVRHFPREPLAVVTPDEFLKSVAL